MKILKVLALILGMMIAGCSSEESCNEAVRSLYPASKVCVGRDGNNLVYAIDNRGVKLIATCRLEVANTVVDVIPMADMGVEKVDE